MATTLPPPGTPVQHAASDRSGWRLARHELLAIFAFWTVYGVLITANRLLDDFGPEPGVNPVHEGIYWMFNSYLWAAATPVVFWLAWRFGVDRSSRVASALIFVVAGVVIVTVLTVARDIVWRDVFQFPRFGPQARSWSLLSIVMRPWFLNDLVTCAGILAAGFAREYFVRYRTRQQEAVRLEAHAAQLQAQLAGARLEALRMQLNPHFLFNTLHAISSLVERDPRGVRRMIARLSELLRYTLNGASSPEVTVEQELHFLQRYLEIMQVRFQGRLEIDMTVGPEASGALVPTLILQPLVENAVKHGVSNLVETGRIAIAAERRGEWLVLTVRDNGPGPQPGAAPSAEGGGVGLRNVRERLEELYGEHHHLGLACADGGGAVARVELPYHTGADLRAAELSTTAAHVAE